MTSQGTDSELHDILHEFGMMVGLALGNPDDAQAMAEKRIRNLLRKAAIEEAKHWKDTILPATNLHVMEKADARLTTLSQEDNG